MGLPVAYEEDFNFPYQTYGVPCERDLVQNRLSKLRIEVFDATTSHLPELIHLPYFEIDPSAARTLPELLVYLQRQVPNVVISRATLKMDAHNGIEARTPMEIPAQSTDSTDETYNAWWIAKFVWGRPAAVTIKLMDTA